MAVPIGGAGGAPNPYQPVDQTEPIANANGQQEKALEDAHEEPLAQNPWGDDVAGQLPDGTSYYIDSSGEGYILKDSEHAELQREFHDKFGPFYKDDSGVKFSLSGDARNNFVSNEDGTRTYDDRSLNKWGDSPQIDDYDRECYRDNTGEIYYLQKSRYADESRIFYDKNGQEYFKDLLGNRFEKRNGPDGVKAFPFEFNEVFDRVQSDARLVFDQKPSTRDLNDVAEDLEGPAFDNIHDANVPPAGGKDLKNVKANDITDDVKKKIQEFNQDHDAVTEIDILKKHEAAVDRKNMWIGIGVGVLAVAAIVAIVASGGIAGGIIGAVAAGAMAGHQGIHAGTRAPENQSREAGKAKARMEDLIETDSQFIKNLKADDEKRGIKRDFSILSETAKRKAEKEYNDPITNQVDDLLEGLGEDELANRDLGNKDDWDYTLEGDDGKSGKKAKKERDDILNDVVEDDIYNL